MSELHGCGGVGRRYRMWARTLNSWGYAALWSIASGHGALATICNHGELLPPAVRARDAFNGADYLRSLPFVDPLRIGVIGFSHGGSTVLKAVLPETTSQASAKPFHVAVAFYPDCEPPRSMLVTDTMTGRRSIAASAGAIGLKQMDTRCT
jgi:dienelactone hydrolase